MNAYWGTGEDSIKPYLEVALRHDEMKVCIFAIYEHRHMSYQIRQRTFFSTLVIDSFESSILRVRVGEKKNNIHPHPQDHRARSQE